MEACLRRAGPRAAGLLQDAAKTHSDFYSSLKVLTKRCASSFDPSSPLSSPPPSPPTKALDARDDNTLNGGGSDDGDLFSRDGSSASDSEDISSAFNLSLDNIRSTEADLLVAFVPPLPLMHQPFVRFVLM